MDLKYIVSIYNSNHLYIASEKWVTEERAGERPSPVREKCEETDEAKDNTPGIAVIAQGSDLIFCRYFLTTTEEGCK